MMGKALFGSDAGNNGSSPSVGPERNEQAARRIETCAEVQSVKLAPEGDFVEVRLKEGHEDGSFLPEWLIAEGFRLERLSEKELDLENVFMEITKGITN